MKNRIKLIQKPRADLNDREFYLRSFTWGLPVNVGGAVAAAALLATGHKPDHFGSCLHFSIGKGWGGGSLGVFIFTCKNPSKHLLEHEHGHSIQNCYYGPLMPFMEGFGGRLILFVITLRLRHTVRHSGDQFNA